MITSQSPNYLTPISVTKFTSLYGEHTVPIRPLTILAGANSSGKSSLPQSTLLLKQTLESPVDPGPLRLNGPNMRLLSFGVLISLAAKSRALTTPASMGQPAEGE